MRVRREPGGLINDIGRSRGRCRFADAPWIALPVLFIVDVGFDDHVDGAIHGVAIVTQDALSAYGLVSRERSRVTVAGSHMSLYRS